MIFQDKTFFQNKVALVTGASTGVGAAIAKALYQQGARVIITARNLDEIGQRALEIDPTTEKVIGMVADVRDPHAISALIDQIEKQYGRLDYVVNNAGITGAHQTAVVDCDLDEWQQVLQTNVSGTFYVMKYALPLMEKTGGGSMVNLSAVNGYVGIAGIAPYTASKHAVIGLTQSAALEYAQKNIRINAIAPGYVATPKTQQLPAATQQWMAEQHPMQRLASTEEVANTVLFLLSPLSSFTTGAVYPVDGGYLAQ